MHPFIRKQRRVFGDERNLKNINSSLVTGLIYVRKRDEVIPTQRLALVLDPQIRGVLLSFKI